MKKITALILISAMSIVMSACGLQKSEKPAESTEKTQTSVSEAASKNSSQKSDTPKKEASEASEPKAAATEHKHKYTAKKTDATCSQKGYTVFTCSCGNSYTDDYVTGKHEYVNNRCKYCQRADVDGIYNNLKAWVLKNGTVNGDYVSYSKTSDTYGGYATEYFSLFYWNDTEKLEFCLHSPLDETYSHNFYIYIPKAYSGNYDYISSYYYRDSGVSKYESKGYIEAAVFNDNYPLKSTSYYGTTERQNSFLEESRIGICDALKCLGQFLQKEKTGYTLSDLGFVNFK